MPLGLWAEGQGGISETADSFKRQWRPIAAVERIRLAVNSHGGRSHLQFQQVSTPLHSSPRLSLGFTAITTSHAKVNSQASSARVSGELS